MNSKLEYNCYMFVDGFADITVFFWLDIHIMMRVCIAIHCSDRVLTLKTLN